MGFLGSYKLPTSHLTRVYKGWLANGNGAAGTPQIQKSGRPEIKREKLEEKRKDEERFAALCDSSPTSSEHELADRGWPLCPPLSDPNRISY